MTKKCEEMVNYYSHQQNYFNEYPTFHKKLNNLALSLDKGLLKRLVLNYFPTKAGPDRTCSCRGFCKNAICSHSLSFSHLKDLNRFGPKYSKISSEFVYKNKKGRKGCRYKNATSALMVDDD